MDLCMYGCVCMDVWMYVWIMCVWMCVCMYGCVYVDRLEFAVRALPLNLALDVQIGDLGIGCDGRQTERRRHCLIGIR